MRARLATRGAGDEQLIEAILAYIDGHNADPKPVVWTKTAQQIIAKVGRARMALIRAQQAESHH